MDDEAKLKEEVRLKEMELLELKKRKIAIEVEKTRKALQQAEVRSLKKGLKKGGKFKCMGVDRLTSFSYVILASKLREDQLTQDKMELLGSIKHSVSPILFWSGQISCCTSNFCMHVP